MRDFSFWRDALNNTSSMISLIGVGGEIAEFKKEPRRPGESRLTESQLTTLRDIYSKKMDSFKKGVAGQSAAGKKSSSQEEETVIAKVCAVCGKPIPLERLEAVPNTVRCVPCQEKVESGETERPKAEKCPKCGSVMVWKMTKNRRPAKYFLACSGYPKCTYIGVSSF